MKLKKSGALSALFAFLIFLLVGAISVILTESYGAVIDLTENSMYTLSETTEQLLNALSNEVVIRVFDQEADSPLIVRNLLTEYQNASPCISVVYCDPYRNPVEVRSYTERGLTVSEDSIGIECDGDYTVLKIEDLYQLSSSGDSVEALLAEQKITSAIAQISSENLGKILFSDGHGEVVPDGLTGIFKDNRYTTGTIELSVQKPDDTVDLIVICAPRKDFTAEETAVLEDYLENGGSLMLFWQVGTGRMENLLSLTEDYGIGVTDLPVHEPGLYISGSDLNVAAGYMSHEINSEFSSNRAYVITPSCAALEQIYYRQGTTSTAQVLVSSSQSFLENGSEAQMYNLALTSQRSITQSDGSSVSARMFVCGSSKIYEDDILNSSKLANREFLAKAAEWCIGERELISVPAKDLTRTILPITMEKAETLAVFMIGVLPLLLLLTGAVVFFRRRYL